MSSLSIPFTYISPGYTQDREMILSKIDKVLTDGPLIMGPELELFEQTFAKYCEASSAVGVGNGLDAITLILKAMGISAGDEVIVPSHTFIASWLPVSSVGATVVPVATDLETYCISIEAAKKAVTDRTRAIIGVHLYGHPFEAVELRKFCDEKGIYLVEDCAQAHGATLRGRKVGSFGHAAAFSFYPTKTLGAMGDAGIVVTSDDQIYKRIMLLRNYGSVEKYNHEIIGGNSRLDEVQAAFLNCRLKRLDSENMRRRQIATMYNNGLTSQELVLPLVANGANHAYHLYVVRHPERDRLRDYLKDRLVDTLIHYPIPCHRQRCFKELGIQKDDFPCANKASAEVLSLPLSPFHADEEIEVVIDVINRF